MIDMTGGLAERYDLSKIDETLLYEFVRRSFSANAFITCSRKGDWRQAHASDVNGLVQGHAYTITGKQLETLTTLMHLFFNLAHCDTILHTLAQFSAL